MKNSNNLIITTVLFLALTGGILLAGPGQAIACGYGSSGGSNFVPQRRDSSDYLAGKTAVTPEQAGEIVSNHISKLNPGLEVGNINDAGGFYEVEILSEDKEILQLLGVDKFSGKLMLLE